MVTNSITYGVTNLQSESVSYTRNGQTKSVKETLDELITKSSKVDDLERKVTDYEQTVHYLADKVNVGDYVAYDAGTWKNSSKLPTSHGNFGGYEAGTSKNESVSVCGSGSTNLKGWRVLKIVNKQVYLVHAGQPECYYYGVGEDSESSIKMLNDEAAKEYKNSYADSAHAMTQAEAYDITKSIDGTDETLRTTGDYYWVATKGSSISLWYVNKDGYIFYNDHDTLRFGFRPVIVLKSTVLTTGQGSDGLGHSNAWKLA